MRREGGREERRREEGGKPVLGVACPPRPPAPPPERAVKRKHARTHTREYIDSRLPPARTHSASGRPERRLPLWTPGRQSLGILPRLILLIPTLQFL